MRATTLLALALAASGCTLILKPDRDAIVPDLDGGVDAGDGGIDAGDGGMDGGDADTCRPEPEICNDGLDQDCDGLVDCFDYDCRGVATCCRPGRSQAMCLSSVADFRRLPDASDIVFSDTTCVATSRVVAFGPAGRTRALVTERCMPLNFGMQLSLRLRLDQECTGTACDYAALSFGPTRALADGSSLASELRVVLSADGSVSVDRAGTPIGVPLPRTTLRAGDEIEIQVELQPGPDARGRDVLFATVDVSGARISQLLERTAVLPLDALECILPAGNQIGLFVAVEGAGNDVHVVGALGTSERQCSNPSQFRSQQEVGLATIEACAPGGVGAPALVNYCRSGCGSSATAQVQWDLWVDASNDPRDDDDFRFVDFGACGYAWQRPALPTGALGDDWSVRRSGGFLAGDSPSVREPTVLALHRDGADPRVSELWYAYAQRDGATSDRYEIRGGRTFTDPPSALSPASAAFLTPEIAGCESLRDPLLVARHVATAGGHDVNGAWLLFTCERTGVRSIGVARLDTSQALVSGSVRLDVLSPIPAPPGSDNYASRAVFAPEGFSEASDSELTVRLWYLARDGRGEVRLAYAQGRSLGLGEFPDLEPYPANPILDGASLVLGACSSCSLTGASITPSFGDGGDYQLVIARARQTPTGRVHELVPLLQPSPND